MQRLDRAFNLELNKWHRLGVSLKYSRDKADVYGYCVEYLFDLTEEIKDKVKVDDIRDRLDEFRPGKAERTDQHYFSRDCDEIVLDSGEDGVVVKNVKSGNTLSCKDIDGLYFTLRERIVKKFILDSGPAVFGLFDSNVRENSLE